MTMTEPGIRQLGIDEAAKAAVLFAAYPFKTPQRIVQKLDPERLNAFYAAGLGRAVQAGRPHWVAESDGRPAALAGLSAESWQSEVYGLKMGKVQPWLCTIRPETGPALLAAAEAGARAEGFEHLSVRLDGEDFKSLHVFEAAGWKLVDVSLKFSHRMPLTERHFAAPAMAGGWRIEAAAPDDAPWIRPLGATTHGGTHYLNDPALPVEKTHELFARWVDRCLRGLAWRIDVLRDSDGQGRGFVTWLRNESFARAVGRTPLILDFVLLDPSVRGGGLGPWFIEETLSRAGEGNFDFCELRTSAHNLPAVIGYEKLGFRCCASDFVLHKRI
jgi:GNAT superfamily N-acetyltransferase